MSNPLNVKKAERRAMSLQFKDGLLETNLGAFFTLLALIGPLEEAGISRYVGYLIAFTVFIAGMIIYTILKAKVVSPRLGKVKLSPRSNAPKRWLLIVAVVIQMITLLIFYLSSNGTLGEALKDAPSWIVDAGFGLAIFAFFALMGYYAEAPRFYLYGLLLGLAMPIQQAFWPGDPGFKPSPNMIAGVVMVAVGIWVFARFIRQYPIVVGEATDGQN
jgi:hypothetical protein